MGGPIKLRSKVLLTGACATGAILALAYEFAHGADAGYVAASLVPETLATLALATILSVCAAVLLGARYVAEPLDDLCTFVDGVRQSGDLSARAIPRGSRAVARLTESINGMLAAQHAAECGRRTGEARYRTLVENLRDVVFTLDREGTITYASPATGPLLACAPDQLLARPLADLSHPDDREAVRALVARVLAGQSAQAEYRMVRADGVARWVLLSMRPQGDEGGIVGVHGILSDVTERRALENQLRQSQKMEAIGQLSEGIAHDLNNVLMVINGYTASALQAMSPRDPLREDILRVHRAGERGASLTRRLLTFGRQRLGTVQLVALGETIRHTSDMLRRMTGDAIRLELDLPSDELYLQAEPGQIEQIIMNLALNARDAMPQGGALTIAAQQVAAPVPGQAGGAGSSIVLQVRDTGQGMTPEVLQHVYEPFYTTKDPANGAGVGLATVYGIVRQNHGVISIDSTVGVGTSVTIHLPAATAPAARQHTVTRDKALPRGTESVLLVEDQQEVRLLAQRMLQHMGYRVDASGNPADVLAVYDGMSRPYDLVLSDVAMPQMSGPEFVSRLRERSNDFAVVYMSGYNQDAVFRREDMRPNERFLQKPFTAEQLAAVVRTAIDGHRPQ